MSVSTCLCKHKSVHKQEKITETAEDCGLRNTACGDGVLKLDVRVHVFVREAGKDPRGGWPWQQQEQRQRHKFHINSHSRFLLASQYKQPLYGGHHVLSPVSKAGTTQLSSLPAPFPFPHHTATATQPQPQTLAETQGHSHGSEAVLPCDIACFVRRMAFSECAVDDE